MAGDFDNHLDCSAAIAGALIHAIPEPWEDIRVEAERFSGVELSLDETYQPSKGRKRKDVPVIPELGLWFLELAELVSTPEKGFYRKCVFTVTKDRQYQVVFAYDPPKRAATDRQFKNKQECAEAIVAALDKVVTEPWSSIYLDFENIDDPEPMIAYKPHQGGSLLDVAIPPGVKAWCAELLDLAGEEADETYRRFILDWHGGDDLDIAFYERGLFG